MDEAVALPLASHSAMSWSCGWVEVQAEAGSTSSTVYILQLHVFSKIWLSITSVAPVITLVDVTNIVLRSSLDELYTIRLHSKK